MANLLTVAFMLEDPFDANGLDTIYVEEALADIQQVPCLASLTGS